MLLLIGFLITSCEKKSHQNNRLIFNKIDSNLPVPNEVIQKSSLEYDRHKSLWLLHGQKYSGYMIRFHKDSILKEKVGILNGKKQGQAIKWYSDGQVQEIASYHHGKLHGEKKIWSSDTNHNLMTHLHYYLGKAHGEQRQWYQTGEIYKILHLNMGKEEGMQRAFRKNGDLYANYEAKNGRIFGLKKASLCYGLEEEKIKSKK